MSLRILERLIIGVWFVCKSRAKPGSQTSATGCKRKENKATNLILGSEYYNSDRLIFRATSIQRISIRRDSFSGQHTKQHFFRAARIVSVHSLISKAALKVIKSMDNWESKREKKQQTASKHVMIKTAVASTLSPAIKVQMIITVQYPKQPAYKSTNHEYRQLRKKIWATKNQNSEQNTGIHHDLRNWDMLRSRQYLLKLI